MGAARDRRRDDHRRASKHGVYEVTFVLQGAGHTAYFAGDTMVVPEPYELPGRFSR